MIVASNLGSRKVIQCVVFARTAVASVRQNLLFFLKNSRVRISLRTSIYKSTISTCQSVSRAIQKNMKPHSTTVISVRPTVFRTLFNLCPRIWPRTAADFRLKFLVYLTSEKWTCCIISGFGFFVCKVVGGSPRLLHITWGITSLFLLQMERQQSSPHLLQLLETFSRTRNWFDSASTRNSSLILSISCHATIFFEQRCHRYYQ